MALYAGALSSFALRSMLLCCVSNETNGKIATAAEMVSEDRGVSGFQGVINCLIKFFGCKCN